MEEFTEEYGISILLLIIGASVLSAFGFVMTCL